jgi:peptide/nickel transport system substrate-binding protein
MARPVIAPAVTESDVTMRRTRVARFVACVGALSVLAAACSSGGGDAPDDTSPSVSTAPPTTTEAAPKVGGTVTMGVFSETAGLDPVLITGGGTAGAIEGGAIFDYIMRYDFNTKRYEPQTAESLNANADFSEWTLRLRGGIKFTDGTDYDADAVVFALKRHTQFSSPSAFLVSKIKEYAVLDKLTVKFTLTTPWANFPYLLASTPGMIPSPTAVKAACGVNPPTPPNNCLFNDKPIGAGPYKVESYTPRQSINLIRNTTYYGGKPYLTALSFVVMPGAAANYDALVDDTLQMAFLREPETVKQATDEKKVETFVNLQWLGGVALFNNGKVNCRSQLPAPHCRGKSDGVVALDTVTSDVRIRRAAAYALDANAINQQVNAGAGYPGGEFFQKSSKWASSAPVNTYNVEEARRLVAQVKAEGKWDGSIRVNCHNAPRRQSWAEAMRTALTAVGFTVKLKNDYDHNALVADVVTNKAYDVTCWGLNVAEEAPELALQQAVLSTSAQNVMNYINPEVDAQIKIAREGKTDVERKAALDRIQDIWRADMPAAVYEAVPEMIAWQKNVHGLKTNVGTVVLFDKAWIN